jgi:trimeric autotransporter adhesin
MCKRAFLFPMFVCAALGQGNYTISTLIGSADLRFAGGDGLWSPRGVAVGPSNDIYIADTEMNRILRVTRDGHSVRVAGKGIPIIRIEGHGPGPQFSGDGGPATSADLDGPNGVAVDLQGSIYISDSFNNRVRKVASDGTIRTIAGTGEKGYAGDGGPATAAKLAYPMALALDAEGNVYVADRENNRVRKITPQGTISTIIGSGRQSDSKDGPARSVHLNFPHGVAVDANGILYVADTFNNRIRRLDPDGIVRSIAGTGKFEFIGDDGPATKAGLGDPDSLAIDGGGNIFVADRGNWVIRKITKDGIIHTIGGDRRTGSYGSGEDGGPALKAPMFPTSVAVDVQGNVYLTDHNRIRVLTPELP